MNRIIWLTDLHLNCAAAEIADDFLGELARLKADALLLTGDLSESPDVEYYLERLQQAVARPVFFVLGNHDFYFGSIATVRTRVAALCEHNPQLIYMTGRHPVELAPATGLIGHDGWADGRLGDYERSMVRMHDFRLIEDLIGKDKYARWSVMKSLGDEAARHLEAALREALDRFEYIYLITHVPPFRAACWHEGRLSNDEWAPYFTCQAVGDTILQCMGPRPKRRLTVLCGHTHGSGVAQPLPNVRVLTGGATYGYPGVAGVISLDRERATWERATWERATWERATWERATWERANWAVE